MNIHDFNKVKETTIVGNAGDLAEVLNHAKLLSKPMGYEEQIINISLPIKRIRSKKPS